jgi:uncharacterized protein
MPELFRLQTDRVTVYWSGPAREGAERWESREKASTPGAPGTLRIRPRRLGLVLEEGTHRLGVPSAVARNLELEAGPPLFEETSYDLFIRAPAHAKVRLTHRDATLVTSLSSPGDSALLHGSLNFRGQVGESRFSVLVDDEPELDFTVEVFPSKITYREDFEEMVARIQDLATGLALEYLRATYHLGAAVGQGRTSRLEWISLLRHLLDGLERALRFIASRPARGLVREPRMVRAEQLRRGDHTLRQAVLRDRGRGPRHRLRSGIPVRAHLPEERPHPTLDTSEHRWLATQVTRARRRLAGVVREEQIRIRESRYGPSVGDLKAISELQEMEARLAGLEGLEPLAAATRPPPSGFASLQLQGAPGYREAFRALTILQQGLRIGGGPVALSLKDLHLLYEYWCFLELVQLTARVLDHPISPGALVDVRGDGLRLKLEQGRTQRVPFELPGDRSLEITYNPTFQNADVLLPQRPDVVLTFRDPHWPTVRLVLDAKYRIERSKEFLDRFGAPGPPADAVNVLHRYRDAILEAEGPTSDTESLSRPTRTVVEGAALFPLDAEATKEFKQSRFWESLERLGVGALPFLPGSSELVEEWLRRVLARSGWETAARTVGYHIRDRAGEWARQADEAVLLGVLRGKDPASHLDWIRNERMYYTSLTPTQARQLSARWVAIYSPSPLRGGGQPGAVTHVARVEDIEVRDRGEIDTPWLSTRKPRGGVGRPNVLYRLGPLKELPRPVVNRGLDGAGGTRFSTNRWTSRLALGRATEVTELLLESRAEWTVYERLTVEGRSFQLRVDRAPAEEPGREGRVSFDLGSHKVRWAGMKGWEVWEGGRRSFTADPLHRP